MGWQLAVGTPALAGKEVMMAWPGQVGSIGMLAITEMMEIVLMKK